MRIIGLIIILVMVGVMFGAEVGTLIDVLSILIIILLPVGMLIFGCNSIPKMFKAVFSGDATAEELKVGVKGWKMARIYTFAAGGIGLMTGILLMLVQADDWSQIGPGLAVSLLTVFYALLLGYGIYLPLQSRLEDRLEEQAG